MLQQKEVLFQSLLVALPFSVVVTNGEGRLVFINDQTEKTFGYDRNELLGQTVELLVPDRFRKTHVEHRADYMVKPRTRLMGSDLVLSGRRKDGSEFPVEISICPVSMGDDVFVTAIIKDITVRKQTEEALQEAEARLRLALQAGRIGTWDWNMASGKIVWSRGHEELWGMAAGTFKGTYEEFDARLHPEDRGELNRAVAQAIAERRTYRHEYRIVWPDGSVHWIAGQGEPFFDDGGKPVRMMGVVMDITDHKRMEEALRESERQFRNLAHDQERQLILSERLISFGEMTASLAHEFNNPLGIVIGFAQDLLTEVDPADSRYQSVKIIEEEARRCKKIMQDLLDFGRQTPPQFTQIEPMELVRKSIALLATRFHKARIRPVIEDLNGLPKIWVDVQQMGQVMVNLFFNAIEAMPSGGTLTVGLTAEPTSFIEARKNNSAGWDEVIIAVTDTGHGIESDNLSKIFLPFFTTKSKKGMGLGLSICKSIMEAHGGKILAESSPGRGTTFYLHLPVDRRRDRRNESVIS